jgi:ubiquinone/menaquinone biosynthesis C-methylase UbiE
MKRVVVPELLDVDAGTEDEVRASLEDLRWLNRYFGGLSTTTRLLARVAEKTGVRKLSYLDVASATGDGPLAARAYLARRGVELDITLLDRATSHLGRHGDGAVPTTMAALCGDALQLPFADNSFDAAGSSLFVHHLEPEEVVQFVNEGLRVVRHAVIINDLRRSFFHWLASRAGVVLYRSRITRFDAGASVRRAYTPEEMRAMLTRTAAGEVEIDERYFYRMGVVIWK